MHKIIKKISQAVQVLLLAPIKLPGKAMNIIKYVAVGLGVLEAMTNEKEEQEGSDGVIPIGSGQASEKSDEQEGSDKSDPVKSGEGRSDE